MSHTPENNYDLNIFNGDIGRVIKVVNKVATKKETAIVVKFKENEVELTYTDLENLTHAYAISIHKSQGSEFNVVILPISEECNRMLTKKIIYTAITRAREKLIVVGNLDSFTHGIQKIDRTRVTALKDFI